MHIICKYVKMPLSQLNLHCRIITPEFIMKIYLILKGLEVYSLKKCYHIKECMLCKKCLIQRNSSCIALSKKSE